MRQTDIPDAGQLDQAARRLAERGADPAILADAIARAETISALADVFAGLRDMALRGAEAGVEPQALGLLLGDGNDRILARTAELVASGLARPPVGVCLMVLGSEGRREQYFATDQDNALIAAADAGSDPEAVAAFSGAFIAALTAIGFPPCENRVMIDNPEWRKSLPEWKDAVDDVVRAPDGPGILMLSLLADARAVAGDADLCRELAGHLRSRVQASPVTMGYLAREALRFAPPLGFFHALVLERDGPDKGGLDVKKGGIFALVQGLRTLAMEHDIPDTNTLERLKILSGRGVFSRSLAERLAAAYTDLQTLRVRFQARALRQGRPATNMVFPDSLPPDGRDRLKASLRAVAEFQELLSTRYGLHLFP